MPRTIDGAKAQSESLIDALEEFIMWQLHDQLILRDEVTSFAPSSSSCGNPCEQNNERKRRKLSLKVLGECLTVAAHCYANVVTQSTCTERDLYYAIHAGGHSVSQQQIGRHLQRLCDGVRRGILSSSSQQQQDHPSLRHLAHSDELQLTDDGYCVSKMQLGVVATAKAILVGPIILEFSTSTMTNIDVESFGGSGFAISSFVAQNLQRVKAKVNPSSSAQSFALLVVEKESTLRHLITVENILDVYRCAVLCSKGFPCNALRVFLRKFHSSNPQSPIWIMTDGDVYGLHIAWCMMRAPSDDQAWILPLLSELKKKASSKKMKQLAPLEKSNRDDTAATVPLLSKALDNVGVMKRDFLRFVAKVVHIGLHARQIQSLHIPQDQISTITSAENNRVTTVRNEISCVIQHLEDEMKHTCDHGQLDNNQSSFSLKDLEGLRELCNSLNHAQKLRCKAELQAMLTITQHNTAAKNSSSSLGTLLCASNIKPDIFLHMHFG